MPDFPDPDKQGDLVIAGSPGGDLAPNSPTIQSAQKARGPIPSSVTPAQEDPTRLPLDNLPARRCSSGGEEVQSAERVHRRRTRLLDPRMMRAGSGSGE